ncbi:unnamed protein product, partial [marine sediment metagenome]
LVNEELTIKFTTTEKPTGEIMVSESAAFGEALGEALFGGGADIGLYDKGQYIYESAFYKVTPDVLWTLANADKVEVRVKGSDKNLDHEFSGKLIKQYKEFCEYCGITEDSLSEEILEETEETIEETVEEN